jgi:RNA polymerase sigma-70 factor (ECF subfamily)
VVTLTDDLALDALRPGGPPVEDWYALHAPAIFSFVARRVGRELAEDLTAQVFVEAIESWPRFDPERGTARTWLFAIATNLVRGHVRREQRALDVLARSGDDPLDDDAFRQADSRLLAEAERPRLAAALRDLAPIDREVLLLHCLADLDYRDIAAVLDLPVGTVASKLSRARRKLRAHLGAPGDVGGSGRRGSGGGRRS